MNTQIAPTHPGEIIKDNLAAIGMTPKRLAEIISMPASILNGILVTGMAAETLVNLQSRYNLFQARNNKKNILFIHKIQMSRTCRV